MLEIAEGLEETNHPRLPRIPDDDSQWRVFLNSFQGIP